MAITPEMLAKSGTEHAHQSALFCWINMVAGKQIIVDGVGIFGPDDTSKLSLAFAVPNGGSRSKTTAAMLRAEGVKPGVPDIFWPIARGGFHGMFIELKRPASVGKAKGTVSHAQTDYINELIFAGYHVITVWGWIDASVAMLNYLKQSA